MVSGGGARGGGGGGVRLKRWFACSGKSSIRYFTAASETATNSKEQCIDPPPFTPPRGILMHDIMCAQNWLRIGSKGTVVKDKRSACAASRSIIEPRVCVAMVTVAGPAGDLLTIGDERCAPSASELSTSGLGGGLPARHGRRRGP